MYAYQSRFPPVPGWLTALLAMALLVLFGWLMQYNGLYGQMPHAHFQLSSALSGRLEAGLGGSGYTGLSQGYAIGGAALGWLTGDVLLALRMLSWLSAGVSFWLFERNIQEFTPGARSHSRLSYVIILLFMSPVFLLAGLTVLPAALCLALLFAALLFLHRAYDFGTTPAAAAAGFMAGLAAGIHPGLIILVLPAIFLTGWRLARYGRFRALGCLVITGLVGILPVAAWLSGSAEFFFSAARLPDWSALNLLQRRFATPFGTAEYLLPNGLYLLFPMMHPGFCLLLPGLLVFTKKTDWRFSFRSMLLFGLAFYLLFAGGLPDQQLPLLLPAYGVLLLVFFPAWDRLVAYGEYFYPKVAYSIIAMMAITQLAGSVWLLRPVWLRHQLERSVARQLAGTLSDGAVVYGFDLDTAMRSYLPGQEWRNLRELADGEFPAHSYLLFNEQALQQDPDGENLHLIRERLIFRYRLNLQKKLPGGWVLYNIDPSGK